MFETVLFSKVKFYEESEDKKHFHTPSKLIQTTKYTQKAELQLNFWFRHFSTYDLTAENNEFETDRPPSPLPGSAT